MDAREEAANLLRKAQTMPEGHGSITWMLTAVLRHLGAIDEDLQKLRKELRTRNGGGENG